MDYGKIIEDYQKILKEHEDCEKTLNEEYKKLTQKIKESLREASLAENSQEIFSQHFSELFEIWLFSTENANDIHISLNNTKSSKPSLKTPKTQNMLYLQKQKDISKWLNFSTIKQTECLPESQEVIEYMLSEIWQYIFKRHLEFLSPGSNKNTKECSKQNEYFHQNWPLYELINQISKTIDKITKEGVSEKEEISRLPQHKKNSVLENSESLCNHILETYILGSTQIKEKEKWLPELKNQKNTQLHHIIITSELISYFFNYKLKETTEKNEYLKKAKDGICDIYSNLMRGNEILYHAMDAYIKKINEEYVIVRYKSQLLCPKIVFIFTLSIIQEIVKKSLTQPRKNIFYVIDERYRANGISEKSIVSKVEKDIKAYKLIYHYFDNPVSATIKKKEEKLNAWVEKLGNLSYGALDDCLLELTAATKISFEETTVTSIKLKI